MLIYFNSLMMIMPSENDYVVFILTHGRPDLVYTYKTLRKRGYTGPIKLVCDNMDKRLGEYIEKFGDEVIVFDKEEQAAITDSMDNFNDLRAVLFARNACFRIARELGYRYFIELDDDYMTFLYKFDSEGSYRENAIKNLDAVFRIVFEFLRNTNARSVAFAQNGDFIGGGKGAFGKEIKLRRKCMNSFFCDTERPFEFHGRINEDVNVYVSQGMRGSLFFTIPTLSLNQRKTQSNAGGLTDIYLHLGTYVKSFYSVMCAPSAVCIAMMGETEMRIHHRVTWKNAVPKILSESLKK